MGVVDNYQKVKEHITTLNPDVDLIAVSKSQDIEKIRELYESGVRKFGESYFDEWNEKTKNLPRDIEWHFIGPMQSRKVKKYLPLFQEVSLIQSLDRNSVVKVLSRSEKTRDVLVQVNLWGEEQKGGVALSELDSFLEELKHSENLQCKGLMAIPPYETDSSKTRSHFLALNSVYEERKNDFGWSTLSMGMSSDYEIAIECGATMVRVGSTIFGKRV